MSRQDYLATGAWHVGSPFGTRKFLNFPKNRPIALDSGKTLEEVTIAYETWGELNLEKSNAILLCHAWTGDSHASGSAQDGQPTPGWWEGLVGPGCAIDTNKWFVVCTNSLGGCQGSTGPASLHPVDGKPYGSRFPVITVRDMVRVQVRVSDMLGIDVWHSVIGGSMGGMQVLEWGITFPHRVRTLVPIATCLQATAQQIAWGAIGRRSIRLDPKWRGGDYYDSAIGDGPWQGLAIARMVAQVTFRSDNVFTDRFGRELADMDADYNGLGLWDKFEVENYLDHHGDKLIRRFDTNSYLIIGKAMDLHDVARGRGGIKTAVARISAQVLVVGISSDILYPTYQQRQIQQTINETGGSCEYFEIDSPHGHDAFLINLDQVGKPVSAFLQKHAL
ncbi:MAG: homoserine O-acetyltransferase [Actinomycetota bacterium]|nr:homoserine O-acetyltransferase [Actinomycetota bacterium]